MPVTIRKPDGHARADAGTRLAVVPDVELFAAGTRGGKEFTTADLDDMARNARQWGHLIKPPVKIGHGELQMLAAGLPDKVEASEGTGVPKIGTVDWTTVRRTLGTCPVCQGYGKADGKPCPNCKGRGQQDILKGSLKDVPSSLARLINGRAYDRVSSEVYDEPPEGVPGKGKTLRAVSLLGGNLPVVKTLADLPLAEYAEPLPYRPTALHYSEARQSAPGVWTCFSEVKPMAESKPVQHRISNKIALLRREGKPAKQAAAIAYSMEDRGELGKHAESNTMRAEHCKKLAEAGLDPKILDEMPDHHVAHLAEHCYAEPDYDGEPPDMPAEQGNEQTPPPPEQMSERRRKMGEHYRKMSAYAEKGKKKFGEPGAAKEPPAITNPTDPKAATEFSELRQSIADLKRETERDLCQKFAENLVQLRKLQASDLDATGGRTIVDEWMDLDGAQKVHKFSEGGKTVMVSARQAAMNRAKARPALRTFGEQARSGDGSTPAASTPDRAAVEQHHDNFSETFSKLKVSKEDFLKSFDAACKHDPEMTADRFLNVRKR